MKKRVASVLLGMCLSAVLAGNLAFADEEAGFAGGSGTAEDPWQIATVEQLQAVREDLGACYLLTEDIDLSGVEFEPIGSFEAVSEEEPETPKTELAFTGSFDGNGHTISNLVMEDETAAAYGLFGCVYGENASVTNLKVKDISLTGSMMVGVIGYAATEKPVEGITLEGENQITGFSMVGGIVGGGFSDLMDCASQADITLLDGGSYAGILVGGLEEGNVENCSASGSVTAEGAGSSVGGLSGCFEGSAYAKNCRAENVTITLGEGSFLIGGLVGHAGAVEEPTRIENCAAENYTITVGEDSQRIGGIVGGGFYISAYAEYYPEPEAFSVINCEASGIIEGGEMAGNIAGYVHNNSTVENCTAEEPQIGADAETVSLDQLK